MAFRFLLACLLFSGFARAQNVQWASRVIEFSSELTDIQYAADQALGTPNVLPIGGESPNAWTPDRSNKAEFLKVGFENPMRIMQIIVAESYSPSTITAVYASDSKDQ